MAVDPSAGSRWTGRLFRAGLAVWMIAGVLLIAVTLRAAPRAARAPAAAAALAPTPASAPAGPAAPGDSLAPRYKPSYELRTGREVRLVFIGASFCGAHRKPGFPAAIEQAKLSLAAQARERGGQFRAVGVSLDWDPREALAFLEGFGAFDELSLGSNWVNDAALRYIWRDLPGDPSVPQILVLERQVSAEERVSADGERLVKRLRGTQEISDWVAAGARI